uniref:Mce/MlaD domain-containing protein n=1 Tax=Chondria tumulosa TaxID=2740715 RepID=A0A896SSY7_9FLOR|nr:hypothetical protein K8K75_pgp144 [Chondria tumulosa]QSD57063.1 hypothetical protein [Chondria tumulosa]
MSNLSNSCYYYFINYFKRVLKIIITILFVTLFILSLKSSKKHGYNIFVEFNNAYRVKKGTNVNLHGVLIGYVDNVSIKSNKVIVLLRINSLNTLIPRNSIIEANQIGLFNDIVIDINPQVNTKHSNQISPISVKCLNSTFICSDFYLKGYKGLNYDDLVRATTRITQRFDDPRFFSLLYLLLQNSIDISDEVFSLTQYISYIIYLLSDNIVFVLFKYFT